MFYITKRNGSKQLFDNTKINVAINAALKSVNESPIDNPAQYINVNDGDSVETIQDQIELWLMTVNPACLAARTVCPVPLASFCKKAMHASAFATNARLRLVIAATE